MRKRLRTFAISAAECNLSQNFAAEEELTGDFSKSIRPGSNRRYQYPLDLEIVNFVASH